MNGERFLERLKRGTGAVLVGVFLSLGVIGPAIYTATEVHNVKDQVRVVASENRRDDERIDELATKVAALEQAGESEEPHLHGAPCICTGILNGKRVEFLISLNWDCDSKAIAGVKAFLPPGFICRPAE